jgi:asparagine synthase (glutamine-hydrolysing)
VVELAFSLPSNIKVRRGVTKWVVKEVAKRVLPPAIVERPKVGFRVPLDAWFRGRLESVSRDLLTSPSSFVAEIFDSATVNRLLSDHASGRRNEEIRIWTLVCLEVWHQTFFKARHTTPRVQEGPPSFTLCDGDGS